MFQNLTTRPYITNKASFSGIYQNYNRGNRDIYRKDFKTNPQDHKLRESMTMIFRELPSQLAIAGLIKDKPADIHILGCSDGSEAYAYAIAVKELSGKNAAKNVKITGLDYKESLVNMAKTGYLICTDEEKKIANNKYRGCDNFLASGGWDNYLIKQNNAPANFSELTSTYPELSQITRDTVAGTSVGNGMEWYKVDTTGFPEINFVSGNMKDYVKNEPSSKKTQVYVLANSVAYLERDEGPQGFIKLFEDIQNHNNSKETYIVFGDVEADMFKDAPFLADSLEFLGFEKLSKQELSRAGVNNPDEVSQKIWKLKEGALPRFHHFI